MFENLYVCTVDYKNTTGMPGLKTNRCRSVPTFRMNLLFQSCKTLGSQVGSVSIFVLMGCDAVYPVSGRSVPTFRSNLFHYDSGKC